MNDKGQIQFLTHIPAVPPRAMILARLGYRKHATVFDLDQRQKLDKGIREGLLLCETRGAFGRFKVVERNETEVCLAPDVTFTSRSLARLLSYSDEVILMVATVGPAIVERIAQEVTHGDAALGVILDAVASETADAGLDWLMDFINKMLRKEGKKLTEQRFSPGYGDLPLANQRLIYDLLKLERLGLKLTEKCMLIPEKSVLAIAGVEGVEIYE